MRLRINSIFLPVVEFQNEVPFSGPHRVIDFDHAYGIVAMFSTNEQSKGPFNMDLKVLQRLVDNKMIQEVELQLPGYMLQSELSKEDENIYEARKTLLAPFLNNEDRKWTYDSVYRGKLVSQQMVKCCKPRKSVLRWLYHFLKYGMFLGSLYPGFSRCGGEGKRKAAGDKKRGRQRNAVKTGHDITQAGINITEEIRKSFRIYIDLYYKKKKGYDLPFVYRKFIKAQFSTVFIDVNGEEHTVVDPNCPTQRQFNYWHEQDADFMTEIIKRKGIKKFNLQNRGLGGRAGDNCTGPTDKYEIDSTVIDLYCVNEFNRAWLIGRPILYFVVDTFSRMIVGFHLALSGPNWNEARIALFNAFTNKVDFCRRMGVKISQDEWPCEEICMTVLVDRAEMRAHKPRGLKEGLGIEVDLAPPFRGDLKPVVERRFRIINDLAIKWLPGAVRARLKERGERDYKLDAMFTLKEVQEVVLRCVLQHNNHMEFPDLLTREMIRDGVIPTPIAMWNWGLKNMMGSPRKESPRNIFCHLLRKGKAHVTPSGIEWFGIRYTCETEVVNNWRAIARNKGNWDIEIRYMPDSTDHIWYFDQREGSFEQCEILSPEERFKNIRVDECIDAIQYLKLEAGDRAPSGLGSRIDDDTFYENLIAAAASKKPSMSGVSKKEQTANIDMNRQLQRLLDAYPKLKEVPNFAEIFSPPSRHTIDADEQAYRNKLSKLISGTSPEEE